MNIPALPKRLYADRFVLFLITAKMDGNVPITNINILKFDNISNIT